MNTINQITLLVGLPGSGKSTLGIELAKKEKSYFLDDISNKTSDINLFFLNFLKKNHNINHLIISDVYFCYADVLFKAQNILKKTFPNSFINIIYFENSYDKCLNNINYRMSLGDNRKVLNFLLLTSKVYNIPKNITPISIWQSY